MNAPGIYGDRHGAPPPPPDIEAEMRAAGATHDEVRLGIAKQQYEAWLDEQGYTIPTRGRPPRADEAAR